MWPFRTTLGGVVSFGQQTRAEAGDAWWSWYRWVGARYQIPLTITFGEVATHNHFVLDRGGKVFNRTAPVIKLPVGASEDDHLGLLGLLNSSTACFWLKQVCHNKGAGGGTRVEQGFSPLGAEPWESHYSLNATRVQNIPIARERPVDIARALDALAQCLAANLPSALVSKAVPTRAVLVAARSAAETARAAMIALQEELDWRCYGLYDLVHLPPEHSAPPPLRLGERAFEICMARRVESGDFETAWFSRHGSTPVTELPAHWPTDYRSVVERRIALIENDPTIGLLERPEFKRRWSMEPWEDMEREALRIWLLDRLEDTRYWPEDGPRLISTRALTDAARSDADFQDVAEVYAGHAIFDLDSLVADLVTKEAVPFLAVLRYSGTGLRKRTEWEAAWDKQRREDAVDAKLATRRDEFLRAAWTRGHPQHDDETAEAYVARSQAGLTNEDVQKAADDAIAAEANRLKQEEVGAIPIPPKYRTPDFVSTEFWRLRGALDVPKERFVSFPHCARDTDDSLPVLWAGYNHLARAKAIAAWFVERREIDGWPAERLTPLLAGLLELVPWLMQWDNVRIPTKPATHSNRKPATDSDLKPAGVPI
jgi:hypothetical protein